MLGQEQILKNFPPQIRTMLCNLPLDTVEEIRLRAGRPLMADKRPLPLTVTREHLEMMVRILSRSSAYAFLEEIKMGYITVEGGHRAGLCGRTVIEGGKITNIKDIGGINFRIARQVKGCANKVMPYIIHDGQVENTLLVSPIQCGKTTLLRDIARCAAAGYKVAIADERGEIAACFNGVPQHDVGDMTDVMDMCPKREGIEMLLRSMSPDILITDELGEGDMESVKKALGSGTKIIAAIHGDDIKSAVRRIGFEGIIKHFGCLILLGRSRGPGTVEQVVRGGDVFEL